MYIENIVIYKLGLCYRMNFVKGTIEALKSSLKRILVSK